MTRASHRSGLGALPTLHAWPRRPPFALSLSKRSLEPFALSLSKRPPEPFGLSLSKPRGPRALRQAQRERLCAMSATRRQPSLRSKPTPSHMSRISAIEEPR